MRHPVFIAILFSLSSFFSSSVQAGFSAKPVARDLKFPVAIAFSPDGRLFFTERFSGNIRVIENPLMDSPRLVPKPVFTFGPISTYFERGLLGLALDPDFKNNGYLYAYYSHKKSGSGDDRYRHRLMRITVIGNRGGTPVALLDELPIGSQSEFGRGNHNGGSITFGPDGKLYLTIGDLATPQNSQNLDSFAGKILRINTDGSAPKDNPFYNPKKPDSPRSYVFALGLRNSFDFTFGPGPGGKLRLFATENGPEVNDELNMIQSGMNYGWGKTKVSGMRGNPQWEDPILVYRKPIAPTGIAFSRGSAYPKRYRNYLYFADWNDGRIHRVLPGENQSRVVSVDDEVYKHPEGIVDLVAGPDGRLYFTTPSGIFRLIHDSEP